MIGFSLEKQVEIGEAQANDLAGSILTITNDAPNSFPLGDTVVTWNVSDEFGNFMITSDISPTMKATIIITRWNSSS